MSAKNKSSGVQIDYGHKVSFDEWGRPQIEQTGVVTGDEESANKLLELSIKTLRDNGLINPVSVPPQPPAAVLTQTATVTLGEVIAAFMAKPDRQQKPSMLNK